MRSTQYSTAAALMAALAVSGFSVSHNQANPETVSVRNVSGVIDETTPSKAALGDRAAASAERFYNSVLRGISNTAGRPRNPGPGWTNKHVQRLARKRRNVKANRKAHR